MPPQDKINAIKKVVIASNPSILDLVFGCEVKIIWGGIGAGIEEPTVGKLFNISERYIWLRTDNRTKLFSKKSIIEILGRKLQLSDILYAIWQKDPANRTNVIVESAGTFIGTDWSKGGQKTITAEWNLLKPFEVQEQPVIDFLYQLLIQGENEI